MTDLWTCLSALKTIKRHMKEENYGIAKQRIEELGMMLDQELEPYNGLGWDYET